ncbi:MAG: hypothetical protein H7831_02770 [Magnetococcus sp. WYHC-3]
MRGVLIWGYYDTLPDPVGFLNWLVAVLESGRRVLFLSVPDLLVNPRPGSAEVALAQRVWQLFGLRPEGRYVQTTYDTRVVSHDSAMVEFERRLEGQLPPYPVMVPVGGGAGAEFFDRGGGGNPGAHQRAGGGDPQGRLCGLGTGAVPRLGNRIQPVAHRSVCLLSLGPGYR